MISRKFGPAIIMSIGLLLATVCFAVLTEVDPGSGFAAIIAGSVVFSLGISPMFTLTNDLIV
jgi:MFS transporter, DHA2 family, multidrug resistance protein